jgi:hypothetical protein
MILYVVIVENVGLCKCIGCDFLHSLLQCDRLIASLKSLLHHALSIDLHINFSGALCS